MSLAALELPKKRLAEGEDAELAKLIEAGCYASWLLSQGSSRPGLHEVVEAAQQAHAELWAVGMRIAMQQASRYAATHDGVPLEEVFQDGCVAVAEAIMAYDYTRGVRFTTFAYECVFRCLSEGIRHRMGRMPVSRNDRRAATAVITAQAKAALCGVRLTLAEAARQANVKLEAAWRGMTVAVPYDDAVLSAPEQETPEDLSFLALLPHHLRRVLELRYGVNGPPLTLSAVGTQEGISASTASRWEKEALLAARRILSRDQVRLISSGQPRAVSCAPSPSR